MEYLLLLLIALTLVFWLLRQLKIFTVCPICSAALLTWVIGVVLLYLGSPFASPLFVALLVGASLGALAEKWGSKLGFFWKALWIIVGSSGAYFLLNKELLKAAPLLGALLVVTLAFMLSTTKASTGRTLIDRFKDCC